MAPERLEHAAVGSLLGLAVGDAIGLPFEGVGPRRVGRLFGGPGEHHLLPGRGMVSDDTEHTVLVAQSLVESGNDVDRYRRRLAWRLRLWFLGLPAGIGFATLRSCVKLLLFIPPTRSGVWSAGNGPAMRAPLLGVLFGEDDELLCEFVRATTVITHRDPKAEQGALAIAHAAWMSSLDPAPDPELYLHSLATRLRGHDADELLGLLRTAVDSVLRGESTLQYCQDNGLGRGVTGYMFHTVPAVIHCWLRNRDDYRAGILELIRCGGDTDTTAAILGGILGARSGEPGIPGKWISGIIEFPRHVAWMRRLAVLVAKVRVTGNAQRAPRLSIIGIALRNVLFTCIVLTHGFRRLLPPY